jgi:hypothetical protein
VDEIGDDHPDIYADGWDDGYDAAQFRYATPGPHTAEDPK